MHLVGRRQQTGCGGAARDVVDWGGVVGKAYLDADVKEFEEAVDLAGDGASCFMFVFGGVVFIEATGFELGAFHHFALGLGIHFEDFEQAEEFAGLNVVGDDLEEVEVSLDGRENNDEPIGA